MLLAAHYYRPPFPERRFWARDLARMKAAGLDALQLWVTWAWVEAEPGVYRFDDYDALFDEAARHGLGVVVSTLGELQPEWIPRLVPDSAMIDHRGHRVISSHRIESNFGLTPGGCTDHPEIARRMAAFLRATAEHFKHRENLVSWDVWNELRWNIHADGRVCHCHHTLAGFRGWLDRRHGGLDGLNRAWHRRYACWEDVMPGKEPGRPYTESMAFAAFLQHRSEEHLRFRAKIFREAGVTQPVGAHSQTSSIDQAGVAATFQTPLCRGNDWVHAEHLDNYGVSHFPRWADLSLTSFMVSVDASGAAARAGGDKPLWISELQGGAANYGHEIAHPVPAALQQRWLWSSVACGAKAVIFWSWCDEVFGREATGFGLAGRDGFADERLAALRETARLWRQHRELLDAYRPDKARVGVWFSPETYQLEAAETAQADKARHGLRAWLEAFERAHAPAIVVASSHLAATLAADGDGSALKLLVIPGNSIVPPEAVAPLLAWVRAGGTLLSEAETDAWNADGFYRAEPEDRPLLHGLGFAAAGRRPAGPGELAVSDGEASFAVSTDWFRTRLLDLAGEGRVLARSKNGEALALARACGAGRAYVLGIFAGLGADGPDALAAHLLAVSGAAAPADGAARVLAPEQVRWRSGRAGAQTLVFLINEDEAHDAHVEVSRPLRLTHQPTFAACELITGHPLPARDSGPIHCVVPAGGSRVVRLG